MVFTKHRAFGYVAADLAVSVLFVQDKPTVVFEPSESLKELREALKNAATWCISLLGWGKMDRHKALRRLELWLGPTEALTQCASQMDVGLLLELRRIFRVSVRVKCHRMGTKTHHRLLYFHASL